MPPASGAATAAPEAALANTNSSGSPATSSDVTTTGGTPDALPLFTTTTNIQNSILTQTGTTAINVGGRLNLPALGTATSSAGFNSRPLDFVASAYNSSTAAAVAQTFQWQAQAADNDTATPSATLNLLFGSGTGTPAQTVLKIASAGLITFAKGQTFPGVPLLSAANTFTGNQAITGNLTDTGNITATGSITGETATFSANTSSPAVGITQSGSGTGLTVTAANAYYGFIATGDAVGVDGNAVATGGYGVVGSSTGGRGVYGIDEATSGASIGMYGQSNSSSGYGVSGSSPNVGVYGAGSYGVDGHGSVAGVKGVATASGGFSGLFQGGPVYAAGNNNSALIGDPGCGSGFAGIGLTGSLSGCSNYSMIAKTTGDTYINSSSSGAIHFRNNNAGTNANGDLATVDTAGNMTVAGTVHSGNAWGVAAASNPTQAFTVSTSVSSVCVNALTAPNADCLVPNMSVTVTTTGGPVLIMANIGGVVLSWGNAGDGDDPCASANFLLVMDDQFIAAKTYNNWGLPWSPFLDATFISLQVPAAGTHTFQVQEWDNASVCGSGDYYPTWVSVGDVPAFGYGSTRTLFVREF